MSGYLMMLNIGPVQGFIATARRTRDLWFGSYALSEVSKAAACSLQKSGATLIFPNPGKPQDLLPDSELNVANRILCIADTERPDEILTGAADAARDRWLALAEEARKQIRNPEQVLRCNLWGLQSRDVLEFSRAWVRYDGQDYPGTLDRLNTLAAARKNTRDFDPRTEEIALGYGLPKSSLDGRRETVLQDGIDPITRRCLGLGQGENLDHAGLVKRLGGRGDQVRFTAVSRIALDPWLAQIPDDKLKFLGTMLEKLAQSDLDLTTRVKGNRQIYEKLPFDGQLLYPFRLEAEYPQLKKDDETFSEALRQLQQAIRPLWRDYGEPCPYVALLLADGDNMGKLLGQAHSDDDHRTVSRHLADFAAAVPDTVRENRGHCIYAGGDDVLALVPLNQVLTCARQLHTLFGTHLQQAADKLGALTPTLSVGIGIQHMIQPLYRLRELAHEAERLAKGRADERDGLAIIVQTRSGAPVSLRMPWKDNPDGLLGQWVRLYQEGELSDKAAYDLRQTAGELAWAGDDRQLQAAEAARVLARKRTEGGERLSKDHINELTQRVGEVGLENLARELIIARWLSRRSGE